MNPVESDLLHTLTESAAPALPFQSSSWRARIDEVLTRLQVLVRPAPDITFLDLPLPVPLARDDDGHQAVVTQAPWEPAAIDQRLDVLTNGRWLHAWQRRGDTEVSPPLISEIDATGVDRRTLAQQISPDLLQEIEQATFQHRAHLVAQGHLAVPSFQHLLIQRLQRAALPPAPSTPSTAEVTSCRVPADHVWQVGDAVSYCRELYWVMEISERALGLESEFSGSLDVHFASDDLTRLRLVRRRSPQ
jgi:hypothetical protein